MCTLILARNAFRFYPLVIAANRDERLSRPSSPPRIWSGAPKVLAPVDDERGGTWIGVNDRGVVAAITNRKGIPSVRGKMSRGDLVLMALEAKNASDGFERICCLEPGLYNAFHLAVADLHDTFLAVGNGVGGTDVDGGRIEPAIYDSRLGDGLHVISNHGTGPGHSARARKIERMYRRRVKGWAPTVGSMSQMLCLHDTGYGMVRDGTCIHRPPEDDYGTKSSSVIRLNCRDGCWVWEYWHRERPEGRPNCAGRWEKLEDLPILA